MSAAKYRPDVGQYMTDKTYRLYVLIKEKANHKGTDPSEAWRCKNQLQTLKEKEAHLQPKRKPSYQPPPQTRVYKKNEDWGWVQEAIDRQAANDKYSQKVQEIRNKWQQESNDLHESAATNTWPTGPRQNTNTVTQDAPPINPFVLLIILFILYLLIF